MKKALALFVALSLCLTSVPLNVFAGETGQSENVTATVSEDDPAADAADAAGQS